MTLINLTLITTLSSIIVSCGNISLNTGEQERRKTPHQEVVTLVEEGRYEEARKLAIEKNLQPYLGVKRVDVTEKCIPILNNCKKEGLNVQEVRGCLSSIEKVCDTKYLTPNHQDTHKFVLNNLITQKEQTMLSLFVKGMCDEGMKWGYVRSENKNCTYCVFTENINYAALHGDFPTKDKCEEARLLESKNVETSSKCHVRYTGKNKTIDVHEALAMHNSRKLTLQFKTKEACDKAVTSGLTYYGLEQEAVLGPKGSDLSSRFIQECFKKELVVCEKYKQGEQILSDIL